MFSLQVSAFSFSSLRAGSTRLKFQFLKVCELSIYNGIFLITVLASLPVTVHLISLLTISVCAFKFKSSVLFYLLNLLSLFYRFYLDNLLTTELPVLKIGVEPGTTIKTRHLSRWRLAENYISKGRQTKLLGVDYVNIIFDFNFVTKAIQQFHLRAKMSFS